MVAYSEYVSDARIRREAESLAKRGDSVDIVCLPHEHGTTRTTLNGVHIIPLNIRRYRGSSSLRYLCSYFTFFWRALLCVSWRHLRLHYDLVQVHTMPDFMVFTAILPRLTGAGVLLDVHDLMPELYMSKFKLNREHRLIKAITTMERASVGFAHRAIAVHQPHLDALVAHGNSMDHFEILLNTPDPSVFGSRISRCAGNSFKLVYHGTISRRHGLEMALRATALARRYIPTIKFSIIGDGDDLDRLMNLAVDLGLDGSVEFSRGSVPVHELPDLLTDADLGIVPLKKDSFTQYMLPVKLMEYVALGIPAVVTRTGTIDHYFDDSMVEYISGESADELAETIVRLYRAPKRREEMARCADEFTKFNNWSKQKLVYYRLVDSLAPSEIHASNRRHLVSRRGFRIRERRSEISGRAVQQSEDESGR